MARIYVKGYTKADGTRVKGYYREDFSSQKLQSYFSGTFAGGADAGQVTMMPKGRKVSILVKQRGAKGLGAKVQMGISKFKKLFS